MYPLKYLLNLYLFKRIAMEFIDVYKATELGERFWVHRKKIPQERRLYIPVRLKTTVTKSNPDGYGYRYIAVKDVKNYLRTKCNRKPEPKHRNKDYKRDRKAN